ncbi:MAG: Rrf2 family transcriptional regulator, partial [Proteobacteria bacterium]|nr:Rrf2 family transcriptional regulator [Pseudomonadota bacterium]
MLTMKAKYALRALCVLADAGDGRLQARQIAVAASVPAKFLEVILVELRKAGLVTSKRGVQGGHALAQPAAEIMVGQVIRTLDGPLAPIRCASVTAYRPCSDCPDPEACALRDLMGAVRDAMSAVVDRRSLAQLARETRSLQRLPPGEASRAPARRRPRT